MNVMKRCGGWQGSWLSLLLLLMISARADEISPTIAGAGLAESSLTIVLGEWGTEVPAGVTLVGIGGGIGRSEFPALSSDRSRIALLYVEEYPLTEAYPVFEIWSAKTLRLLRRIPLVPISISNAGHGADVHDLEVVAAVERQLVLANHILAEDGYRPLARLYDTWETQVPLAGFENFGKKINYPTADGSLVIASSATGRVELKLKMPVIPSISGSEDPLNDCEVRGDAEQAWYEPEKRIVVVRMAFNSARDGCEQPERWILKRLAR